MSLVYDHHTRDLSDKLTEHQHSHHKEIISALHVHLDAHHCLEVVVLKGKAKNIKRLAEELIGTKGVKHGTADDHNHRQRIALKQLGSKAAGIWIVQKSSGYEDI